MSAARPPSEDEPDEVRDFKEEPAGVSVQESIAEPQSPHLQLSPNIQCFVFPRGNINRFKPARWVFCGSLLETIEMNSEIGHCWQVWILRT